MFCGPAWLGQKAAVDASVRETNRRPFGARCGDDLLWIILDNQHPWYITFDVTEREEGFLWDDTLEIHLVEMPKLVKLWREKRIGFGDDEVVEWLLLLEADEDEELRKELEGRAMDNPALQEAMEKWEDLSRDPNAIREYKARHKAMMDRLAAEAESKRRQQMKYEEGREEGERKRAREIARKMIAKGIEEQIIAEVTGLSIAEIEQLKS
jgi:predicted transposase/invertase (TIGR01784 family)